MHLTPCMLQVLIHCHTTPAPHERAFAPAIIDSHETLIKNGLIEKVDDVLSGTEYYGTTERGACHVNQICDLELPTNQWIGANGNQILP